MNTHHPFAITVEARPPHIEPADAKASNPVRVNTRHPLRVDLAADPIVHLKWGVIAALRIEPTVTLEKTGKVATHRDLALLYDDDLAAIDEAGARFAGLHLRSPAVKGQQPVLASASFRTMGSRKGRSAVLEALGIAPGRIKTSVMIELTGVDRGTPPARLTEVVSLLRGVCRGVLVRVQPGRESLLPERGSRLHGVTLDVSELSGDARITSEMLSFGEAMQGVAAALLVHGLPDRVMFDMAEVAGLTHAGARTAPQAGSAAA